MWRFFISFFFLLVKEKQREGAGVARCCQFEELGEGLKACPTHEHNPGKCTGGPED